MEIILKMSISEFLKDNKNTRKIFGKKELEIIFKQLKGLALTQSERNRISRDIKPKLRVIEEIAKFKDEFKLEKNQDNKKIIEKAVGLILKDRLKEDIKAILLFGSHVKETVTPRSDIDICVLFKDISLKEATKFRLRISGDFTEKMDIQVFSVLPQKVKRQIARNHKILYENKEFDNINFSIKYLKDEDFFIRMNKIFGVEI